jgi:multiple sugar transport system ATP-binding protein
VASCPSLRTWTGREVVLGIRPETMEDASLEPAATPDRVVELRVDLVEALGAELLVHARVDAQSVDSDASSAPLVARVSPRSRIEAGDVVKLTVDTTQLHLFDPVSGESLRSGA